VMARYRFCVLVAGNARVTEIPTYYIHHEDAAAQQNRKLCRDVTHGRIDKRHGNVYFRLHSIARQ